MVFNYVNNKQKKVIKKQVNIKYGTHLNKAVTEHTHSLLEFSSN